MEWGRVSLGRVEWAGWVELGGVGKNWVGLGGLVWDELGLGEVE